VIIDILFAIIILTALFKGYSNGIIVAIFSMLALLIGVAAAIKLSTVVAGHLKDSVSISNRWLPIVSFVLVFLVVLLLVRLGAAAIQKTMELVMLGWLNRLAGIVLYSLLYTVIFSVVLFYAVKMQVLSQVTINTSATYHFIQPWGPGAIDSLGMIVPFFKNMFHELESFFQSVVTKKG